MNLELLVCVDTEGFFVQKTVQFFTAYHNTIVLLIRSVS